MLRSAGASDRTDALHPYEKGLLYRIVGKSRLVSIRERDLALQLPDPYQHVDRLVSTRRFFDRKRQRARRCSGSVRCNGSAGEGHSRGGL